MSLSWEGLTSAGMVEGKEAGKAPAGDARDGGRRGTRALLIAVV